MALDKMGPEGLLGALFDGGAFTPLFNDEGGVAVAFGMVGGKAAYAVCQKGVAQSADDIGLARRTLRLAAETGNPVVTFYDAPGAKLEEGLETMRVARRLAAASAKMSGVVPQIAVVCGVCGASSAMAAASADVCVMIKDAELFLSAPALSAAAGDKVEGAGSADAAVQAGVAALVVQDGAQAAAAAAKLVALLPQNNLAEAPAFEFSAPAVAFPTSKYHGAVAVDALADAGSVVELYNGYGDGITTSLCTMAGNVVGIAATNGPDTVLGDWCAAKAARFARLCDAYSIPLVTVLNSGGFAMSSSADAAGNIRQAARLAATYADATCARVAVLVGTTTGTLYTALGGADLTVAVAGSITAPVAPTAAVSVLYKDEIAASGNPIEAETAARARQYEAEVAGAEALKMAGMADFVAESADVRATVLAALDVLSTKRASRLPKKHGNMAL